MTRGVTEQVIESLETRVYDVPTPAEEADGTLTWTKTTAVVVLARSGGKQGLGYTYANSACADVADSILASSVQGLSAFDVQRAWANMVRACRNMGRPGIVSCSVSAVDTALWDLKARLLDVPLATLFGRAADNVNAYGSGGLTSYDDETLRKELEHWLSLGMSAAKIKVGESWGGNVTRDLARATFAREVLGDDVELFVDANGGYRRGQAERVGRRFDDLGVVWFEEPVTSDDRDGLAHIRGQLLTDVAAGEYAYDLNYVQTMLAARAVDCMQLDVTRIGGYTEFLRGCAVAASYSMDVSAHCAPALHVPVATAVPNMRHLEYFIDHARLEPQLFDGVPQVHEGRLTPDLSAPGHGMELKEQDAEKYRVR